MKRSPVLKLSQSWLMSLRCTLVLEQPFSLEPCAGKGSIIVGLIQFFFFFTMETTNMNKTLIRNSQLVILSEPRRLLIVLNVSSNETTPKAAETETLPPLPEVSFHA